VLSLSPTAVSSDELEDDVVARIGRQELLRPTPPPSVRIILDEAVLRRPAPDPKVWHDQLARIEDAAKGPTMTIQVLPLSAGVQGLNGGPLSLLWMADGSAVAYLEGNRSGELIEESAEIERYRLSYDRLRDAALPPCDSSAFIEQLVEDSRP
jgi:hypothetical protein